MSKEKIETNAVPKPPEISLEIIQKIQEALNPLGFSVCGYKKKYRRTLEKIVLHLEYVYPFA